MKNKKLNLASYAKQSVKSSVLAEALPETAKSIPKSRVVSKKEKVGRPAIPEKSKRKNRVTLYLTDIEKAVIEKERGMIPEATYLVSKLREAGVLGKSKS